MKRIGVTLFAVLVIGGVVACVSVFCLASVGAAGPTTDQQVLSALSQRIAAAGVQVESAEVKTDRPHLLSFRLQPADEPAAVSAYTVWRQAALAQLAGLPIGWVEVVAYDDVGDMVYGEGTLVQTAVAKDWQGTVAVSIDAARAAIEDGIRKALPAGVQCDNVQIVVDADGYRVEQVELTGDITVLASEDYANFMIGTSAQASELNKRGSGIAVVVVKMTDSAGRLQLWDIADLQLGQQTGWCNPTVIPGWMPSPYRGEELATNQVVIEPALKK